MVRGRRARRSRFTFSFDSSFLNGPAGTWTWYFADSIDVSFLPLGREEFSRLVAEGPKTFHRGDQETQASAPRPLAIVDRRLGTSGPVAGMSKRRERRVHLAPGPADASERAMIRKAPPGIEGQVVAELAAFRRVEHLRRNRQRGDLLKR